MPTVFRHTLPFALTALLGLTGCQREAEITETSLKRLNNTQRCLGAVAFPDANKSATIWLFELIGPEMAVADVKPVFEKFIHGLRFKGNHEPDLTTLPTGWIKETGDKERVAILRIPGKNGGKDGGLGLDVVQIVDKKAGFRTSTEEVAINYFNLCRLKIGLKKLEPSELKFFYDKTRAGEVQVFLCDIIGPGLRGMQDIDSPSEE